MTDTEKLILEKLDNMSLEMHEMKREMHEMKLEIHEMRDEIDRTNENVTKINILIETDISKKIDIIGEGHDFLKQRLDEALQFEKKRESMELELINLRMDVKKIKEKLDIA